MAIVRVLFIAILISLATGGLAMSQSQENSSQGEQLPTNATSEVKVNQVPNVEVEKQTVAKIKTRGFFSSAFRAIDRSEKIINVFSTLALAVFTALLFVATLILASSTEDLRNYAEEQSKDMKNSIAEAKRSADLAEKSLVASNRPWVKVDISVGGPIFYNVNGVNFTFNYALTNIGHAPATNVWVSPRVIAPDIGSGKPFDPRAELRNEIDTLKSRPASPFGFALFPGETIVQPMTVTIGSDELKKITEKFGAIYPQIVGAADYRMGFDDKAHQTGFVFEVRRSDEPRPITVEKNRWPAAIFTDEGDIPAKDVRIFRSVIEGGFAD